MEDFVSAPWLRRLIAAVVLAGLVVLGFRVLEPFVVPLVCACILAFVSWPAHERLLRLCRGRSTVASLLTTTAVSLAVIAPLAWLAGVLAGLGYWIAGATAPVFLAALTTVFGLIPFAAPTLWGGVGVWLVITGSPVAGVALLIWGAIVVGWTDHIVRPFLISREAQIPF